jgi:tetratricopeptide (TPR) repeat protein
MARLDRLSAAKRVAQLAAVLGREFDHALIAEVADLAPDLLEHGLEQLVADGLLVRDGAPPDATYAFKHVLIQDAAYRSLLKRTRRAVHGRIADALGRRRAGATVPPDLLARHCEAAGRVAEAIAHYRAAADHAARHSAHGEAIAHLHKAVELTAALPEDAARDSLEMDLQVALGSSIMATRGYADPEIATAYERAHELCTALGDDDQAGYPLIGLAIVAFNGGEVERGAQLAERALKVAERLADDALRVLAHVQVGMPRLWQGHRLEALEHADAATGLYDRTRHAWMAFRYGTDQGVAAHSLAGVTLARLGFADQALERMDRAVALAHQLANPFNVVFAVTFQSGVRMMRGEPEAQAALAEQVIAIAEEQAFTDFVGIGRMLRASARAAAGDDAGALAEFLDGMTLAASTGRRGGLPMFLAMLAQTQRVAGRLEDALGAVEAALTLSAQTGQAFWDGELLRIKGELLGDQDLLRRAVDVSHDQRDMLHALMAATSLSRLAPGAADGADAVLRPLFEWFTEGLDTPPLRAAAGLLAPEVSERR